LRYTEEGSRIAQGIQAFVMATVDVLCAETNRHRPGRRRRQLLLLRDDGVVDILFLRRMDAHQGFDRLDHALGVANEVAVDILRR
jgi:hypothetical protein